MKPRIFVSSVSRELKTVRQLVANTLVALGYEPVWQDIFDTSSDDIRPMLRKKIDSCSAVLQIVGNAYGAEPPEPDQEFGRVSYTQYELLYAKSKGKRTYYLIAEDDLPRDSNPVDIDVPKDDSDAAIADATERARLQSVYREQILTAEQVYYPVGSHSDTELSVRRLRDDLAKMRRGFRGWMIGVSAALLLIVGGILWQTYSSSVQDKKLAEMSGAIVEIKDYIINPDRMRDQIERSIEETFESAVAKAQELKGWRDRDEAVKLAERQRDDNLDRVDEFLESIVSEIDSGNASPKSVEFARVLEEEGADEAIAYIASRKKQILTSANKLAEKASKSKFETRKTLAPLFESARLLANKGNYEAAKKQCEEILKIEPSWPDLLHIQWEYLIELGDLAGHYKTIEDSAELFGEAEKLANRLSFGSEPYPESDRIISYTYGKLGRAFIRLGRADDAIEYFRKGLKINKRLADADPSDVEKQRDLSVAHVELGDVYVELNRSDAVVKQYLAALEISEAIATSSSDNTQKRRDVAAIGSRLGNIYVQMGQTEKALEQYKNGLVISQSLATTSPSDTHQRDLSIAHEVIGDVYFELSRNEDALGHLQKSRKINEALVASDSLDKQRQRDLAVNLGKLGDVLLGMGKDKEALNHYRKGLVISKTLATADPTDSQKLRDLVVIYDKIGILHFENGEFGQAKQNWLLEVNSLDQMIANGQNVGQSKREKAELEDQIAQCNNVDKTLRDTSNGAESSK